MRQQLLEASRKNFQLPDLIDLVSLKSKHVVIVLIFWLFSFEQVSGSNVTGLTGFYANGQVFLTWTNATNVNNYYKVYRSTSPINNGSQLSGCEYLGWTNQYSAKDHDLSAHYGQNKYLRIDSAGTPLPSTKGLFVATTLVKGSYYYAVTVLLNQEEDTSILDGNTLPSAISEQVNKPQPVFQQVINISGEAVEHWVNFMSFKRSVLEPPINPAGFMASDFLLYRNNNTGNQPLCVQMHGGGGDLFTNIVNVTSNEMIISVENLFPSGEDGGYWGANSKFNIYKDLTTIPASGMNHNFFQQLYKDIIEWAIPRLNIDSNRIYLRGSSLGACGAFNFTMTYPEKIAAVSLGVPCFNVGFQNDSAEISSLNIGGNSRMKIDELFGLTSTNLPSNLGNNTFDMLNGAWVIHSYPKRDYPFIYAMNGKNDIIVGWTEKTVYYDSVNANPVGGYYFWDIRDHGGNGSIWGNNNFDLFRYRKNLSYPAFSDCSLNENYGNGDATSGADFGSVNGMLDWENEIVEDAQSWEAKVFVRDLLKANGDKVVYPNSGIADITLRRLQKFNPAVGATITWTASHNNQVIDNGSFTYQGGLITIPNVTIFKDITVVNVTTSGGTGCSLNATINPTGTASLCSGSSVTLTANTGSGIKYQWIKNSVNIAGATNKIYKATTAGSYKVKETKEAGCTSTSPVTTVTVASSPTATITTQGNLNICQAGSVVLKANAGSGYTYQWKKGSNNISGATKMSYTATITGSYKVIVTNSNGCSTTSAVTQVTSSCKEDFSVNGVDDEILNLYPNPAGEYLTIDMKLQEQADGEALIQIINMIGQVIYTERSMLTNGTLRTVIHLDNTHSGMYMVNVMVNDELYSRQFMH